MPLLDTPDDIDAELAILLERVLPVFGDGVAEGEVACDAADHHLAQLVVLLRVGVDVLHAAEAGVGFVAVVPGADGVDDLGAELVDAEGVGEEVEVEEGADVFFGVGVAQGFGVEPADEEFEGVVVRVGEAVVFRGGGRVGFVVEDRGEEGGVVAEEAFVQDPMRVFGADVDVHEGIG